MNLRRTAAIVLFVIAAGFLWVAALTPLRSAEIAELDAEARRLGEEWVAATEESGLMTPSEDASTLVSESNSLYRQARELEPPLAPLAALGGGLLLAAAGVALWPPTGER